MVNIVVFSHPLFNALMLSIAQMQYVQSGLQDVIGDCKTTEHSLQICFAQGFSNVAPQEVP